jgi:ABC-type dipeptide/oligopeptide/nickel transport system ATPase component
MIAMALSCNPQVVIGSEPTTALEVMIQAQFAVGIPLIFIFRKFGTWAYF